ncbi:steryl ester hydrolase, putative [Plasmodium knowlesi strain H]|uniref:Steryl ester hydrolase, putative n=3 Tax=Plasmodium knowlesi TaxID=5850 RepID=A0A5K1UN12_PLAKH|nr:steryl ester hydrolase, putative [Plasmodium knowlesi strain H]OTN64898.1 putative Steryl ester hydrolase [Plasmodium knowlesi]CAA9988292.1 steryl ester hydrolase, putative [Plasmodium knowlesi strain H]SBO20235.1 steryl ester hydrolase, putative [Plasmodium knowlesi strain H]SBO20331.1 steryl ester hydrolase, putative [Plasmodium knowlesi strain H]VVS77766.1 steryl ester hydrolase, putative [Plasmodium knowlesi strain H]|eukprot:XP_002259269.1 hypothetical protein, conserved in Plasmodium species [Plasmodium knowlesi strain H]
MSGYLLSNVSSGLGSMWPVWAELKVNHMPRSLAYRDANANNIDEGDGDYAGKDDSSSCSPRDDTCSNENQSNNQNDAKEEKPTLECSPCKFWKGRKKNNNLDSMEELLFKLTNGKFKAEKHHVYTADGYRLNLYRIVNTNEKENLSKKKEVFCLNHGLFESSISYTCKGYESLAFQIFANDYDVWISNNRGNAFTKFVGKNYALKKLRERYSLQDLKDMGVDVSEEMDSNLSTDEGTEGEQQQQQHQNNDKDGDLVYGTEEGANPQGPFGESSDCDSKMVHSFPYVPRELENGDATEVASEMTTEKTAEKIAEMTTEVETENAAKGEDEEEVEELVNLNKKKEGLHDMDDDDVNKQNEPEINNWTFEDMGTKDLPPIIKYIREKTQREKIVYVGFSQGSIQLLVSCCLNDYVNRSIKRTYLLSLPIILKTKGEMLMSVRMLLAISRWNKAVVGSKEFLQKVLPEKICNSLIINSADLLTRNVFKFFTDNVDDSYKRIYYRHTPSGTTSRENLRKWLTCPNHEPVSEAIDKYAYKCSFPITLVYGINDCLVDAERSIEYMKKKFTKNDLKIITKPEWSHIDPILTDNENIVLSCILEDMKREEEEKKQEGM